MVRFKAGWALKCPFNSNCGEMAEWFKAHAWKACVGNTTVGSNPTLSASLIFEQFLPIGIQDKLKLELQPGQITEPSVESLKR